MGLDTVTTYLLLGSNLGRREWYLDEALERLKAKVGSIVSRSGIYETAAWGKTDQPGFLNLAVAIQTNLSPIELLAEVLSIETSLGRIREEKWGARVIDIDIILYGDEIINIPNVLHIPHPEMQNRKFVMQPMTEIAGDLMHPVLRRTLTEILVNQNDPLIVERRNG